MAVGSVVGESVAVGVVVGVLVAASTVGKVAGAMRGADGVLPVRRTSPITHTVTITAPMTILSSGGDAGVAGFCVVSGCTCVLVDAPTAFIDASSVSCTGSDSFSSRKPIIFPAKSRIGIDRLMATSLQ